jgi:hypothetical protein
MISSTASRVHDYEEWYELAVDRGRHVVPATVSDTHSPGLDLGLAGADGAARRVAHA